MPTKIELAKQLEAAMGTASINGAAEYVKRPKAWLENQLHLNSWYSRTEAGFNPALGVKLATNAMGHPQHDVCSVCQRWIGHMGQLWAYRIHTPRKPGVRIAWVQTTACDWDCLDAYCIECASK